MTIAELADTPPWEWPENARDTILAALRNSSAPADDRLSAVRLAAESADDPEMTDQLLANLRDSSEPEDLRAAAAISLGPILEETPPEDTLAIRETLRRLHIDDSQSKELRRRALEASVRSPEDWHPNAIRAAWSIDDPDWKSTAVFAMGYIPGFDREILDALAHAEGDVLFEAVRAAGSRSIDDAWPRILEILRTEREDKDLLIAAMNATAGIRPADAGFLMIDFIDSADPEIAEAALDIMAECEPDDEEDLEQEPPAEE